MKFARWVLVAAVVVAALGLVGSATAWAQDTLTVQCTVAGQTGPCDESGDWQTSPVSVTWEASPAPTKVNGCRPRLTPTSRLQPPARSRGCERNPPTSTISFPLNVESSTPTATAAPSRPPDANGWYNHPVSVSFQGNAFSGIASCAPAQTYGGPDAVGATLGGSCTDNAGKTAQAGFSLNYDSTPPNLGVSGDTGDQVADLSWQATAGPAPLTLLQVTRSPGVGGAHSSLVWQSNTGRYRDTRVRDHVHYTYTITAEDQAGNVTVRTMRLTPAERLLAPATGARVHSPPLLTWTPVPKATYYNVQLFHQGKILSRWPKRASFHLSWSWRFGGQQHRLKPGRYQWYVWPGFGKRSRAHYGKLVGKATFVVR